MVAVQVCKTVVIPVFPPMNLLSAVSFNSDLPAAVIRAFNSSRGFARTTRRSSSGNVKTTWKYLVGRSSLYLDASQFSRCVAWQSGQDRFRQE